MKVVFCGVSHKLNAGKLLPALCSTTPTGKLLDQVIEKLVKHECIKCNVLNQSVAKLPAFKDLDGLTIYNRLAKHNPDLIIALGQYVYTVLYDIFYHTPVKVVHVQHPSYILRFKRKSINEYIESIVKECET